MAYDSVTTAAVAAELQGTLLHGRVDKVIQPSASAVALFIRAARANHTLLLSAHPQQARVTLTGERLAKAFDEPSSFVMLLRKYLEGAALLDIRQVEHDRVLRLTFGARATSVTIIAEVMGKHSNIILVDDQDTILGALKHITPAISRYRVVLPRHPYIPPPAQTQPAPRDGAPKLDPLNPATTAGTLALALADRPDDTSLATALLDTLAGMSPQLAKEVVYRLAGATDAALGAWRPRLTEALELTRGLMAPQRWEPSVTRRDGKLLGWAAYPLLQHGVAPAVYPAVSAVLDEVYRETGDTESHDALGSVRDGLRTALLSHRVRLDKKARSLRAGLRPRAEIDALRHQGEMVLGYAHDIAPGQRELRLDDPPMVVALDPTLTPPENAATLFARYRKMRDAQEKVPPLLEEAEEDVRFLDQALLFVEQADAPGALKEIRDDVAAAGFALPGAKGGEVKPAKAAKGPSGAKGKGGKYHPGGKEAPKKGAAPALRFTTPEGLEVLVGRSARQNEVVTFDLSASGDLWFHARGMPGSHVVLKTGGRAPSDASVEGAAALAAYYSRGRGATTVPVDVVPARNVRRVKGGKPGLVRISGETTLNVRPRATLAD
jgi:predicted ribosome quality control (RQC) complex YloA/Tae2 family protein